MSLSEFLNSKLFSTLFHMILIWSLMYVSWLAGQHRGFKQGHELGLAKNPTPHVVTVTEYVFDNKRIGRFDPRDSNTLVLIDMENQTISRIPLNKKIEKQEVANLNTEQ